VPPDKEGKKGPNLRLQARSKPFQKITLNDIPEQIMEEVLQRAYRLQQKPAVYVRIVLEHAELAENRNDYELPLSRKYRPGKVSTKTLHVPLQSRDFLERLLEWAPYGLRVKRDIAMAILKRHLDITDAW
jgi:hypothetical protein